MSWAPQGRCPQGFIWIPCSGGFICEGSMHFINCRGEDKFEEFNREMAEFKRRIKSAFNAEEIDSIRIQFLQHCNFKRRERFRDTEANYRRIAQENRRRYTSFSLELEAIFQVEDSKWMESLLEVDYEDSEAQLACMEYAVQAELQERKETQDAENRRASQDKPPQREYQQSQASTHQGNLKHSGRQAGQDTRTADFEKQRAEAQARIQAVHDAPERPSRPSCPFVQICSQQAVPIPSREDFERQRAEAMARIAAVHSSSSPPEPSRVTQPDSLVQEDFEKQRAEALARIQAVHDSAPVQPTHHQNTLPAPEMQSAPWLRQHAAPTATEREPEVVFARRQKNAERTKMPWEQ